MSNGARRVVEVVWGRRDLVLLAGVIVFYFLVFSIISIVNHDRFQTFGWDLGFYGQITYQLSRFRFPYSSMAQSPAFGIRFSPILILFAPFYWVWNDVKVLLVSQALLAATAALPVFLVSKFLTKNKFTSLVVAFTYLSFIGLHRAVFFDFHPDTILPFFLAWLYWSVIKGKNKMAMLFAVFVTLHKEWTGLLVSSIGLMFILINKKYRHIGFWMILIGLITFVMVIYGVAAPLAGKGTSVFNYGEVGKTPAEVVVTLFTNPWIVVRNLFNPDIKVETLFHSLWPFAFLPLLAPITLIPVLVQLAVRFLDSSHQQSWTLLYHYSAPLAVLLAMSSAFSLSKIKRKVAASIVLFIVSTAQLFYFHSPIFSIVKPEFYHYKADWIENNHTILGKIPKDSSVAAQNNLAAHLSSRDSLYVLPVIGDAEYVVVDFHEVQSEYNFNPGTSGEVKQLIDSLIKSDKYQVAEQVGQTMLLSKIR